MSIKLKDTIYDLINNSDKLDGKDSSAFSLTTHTHNYASTVKIGDTSYNSSNNIISLPAPSSHTHDYLPLSGGTLTSEGNTPLTLKSKLSETWIAYHDKNGYLGSVGVSSSKTLYYYYDGSSKQIWHSGNLNPSNYLPLSGGTLSTSERVVLNLKSSHSWGAVLGFQKSDGTLISNIGHIPKSNDSSYGAFWTNNEANIGFILGSDGVAYVTTNSSSLSPKYKIWHEGNDGSGSGLDSDLLDGYHVTSFMLRGTDNNTDNMLGCRIIRIAGTSSPVTPNTTSYGAILQWSSIDSHLPSDTTSNANWYYQIIGQTNIENPYFRKRTNGGAWSSPKCLAFTTDNVASATKLQTARTIWGQSFDGSGNITGTLTIPAISGGDGRYIDMNYNGYSLHGANGGWAMGMNVYLNNGTFKGQICGAFGDASSLGYFYYGGEYNNASMYITPNKNVGIGTNSPAYKLEVNGNGRFNKYLVIGASLGQSNTARAQLDLISPDANPCDLYLGADNTKYWSITSRNNADATFSGKGLGFYDAFNATYRMCITQSGNIGIGTTSPTHPLQIYKSSTTNGDMIRLDSNSSWCGIVYRPSGGYVWSLNAGNPNTFNFWNNYIGGSAMEIKQTGSVWIRGNVTSGGFYNKNGDSAQTSSYMWGLYQWGNKIQMTRRNASTEAYESLLYEINIDTKDITFSNNVTVSGSCNVSTLKIGGETITFTT